VALRVGVVTFGDWRVDPSAPATNARDALRHTVRLAVAAEELGLHGFFARVHHFEQSLSSPFPLLGALAQATSHIEIGTAVLDMRYENPFHVAEAAAVTDLLSDGRLQLGVGAGAPEVAHRGSEAFGYVVPAGTTLRDLTREKTELLLAALSGAAVAETDPSRTGGVVGHVAIQPQAPGLADRVWWGSTSLASATWAATRGLHLMSSAGAGGPGEAGSAWPDEQAGHIASYRETWSRSGWPGAPQVAVVRTVIPSGVSVQMPWPTGEHHPAGPAAQAYAERYVGPPEELVERLSRDPAVAAADWLFLAVPDLPGVDSDIALLSGVVEHVLPALGWTPSAP
jgi:alkanesulfonate monooxygenase SsuD/methylene tetrahydromethanopterin reductase-like flavin-dependent oxidoreductase (luciferase family)